MRRPPRLHGSELGSGWTPHPCPEQRLRPLGPDLGLIEQHPCPVGGWETQITGMWPGHLESHLFCSRRGRIHEEQAPGLAGKDLSVLELPRSSTETTSKRPGQGGWWWGGGPRQARLLVPGLLSQPSPSPAFVTHRGSYLNGSLWKMLSDRLFLRWAGKAGGRALGSMSCPCQPALSQGTAENPAISPPGWLPALTGRCLEDGQDPLTQKLLGSSRRGLFPAAGGEPGTPSAQIP